jgi:HEAT repeat protein
MFMGLGQSMSMLRTRLLGVVIAAAILVYTVAFGASPAKQQTETGEQLPVPGKSVPADHGKLSEHNMEWLQNQPPQAQAEFLLEAAVNHDRGATDLIAKNVDSWHGKVHKSQHLDDLEMTALYSNDLRVRAAAIEVNLAFSDLAKNDDTVTRLIEGAEKNPGSRAWTAWELGMLANRGVAQDRIHELLATWTHDPDQQTRFWAVEGLAHIGSDATIKNLLDVFRNDPSLEVRERAGCSLAKSGMLTREQRMKAVPGLLELTDDPSLDATTRSWIYQALREITNTTLRNDPATWRNWYDTQGSATVRQLQQNDSWSVLGNN